MITAGNSFDLRGPIDSNLVWNLIGKSSSLSDDFNRFDTNAAYNYHMCHMFQSGIESVKGNFRLDPNDPPGPETIPALKNIGLFVHAKFPLMWNRNRNRPLYSCGLDVLFNTFLDRTRSVRWFVVG